MNNLKEFTEAILNGNGATFSIHLGTSPTSGYVVADGQNERKFTTKSDLGIKKSVADYILEKSEALNDGNNFLGGWLDDGILYLDVVNIFTKRFDGALAGLKRNELAIYHIDEDECIDLPTKRQTSGTEYQKEAYLRVLAREV